MPRTCVRLAGDLVLSQLLPEPLPEPFALLAGADLSMLNLETPLLRDGRADTPAHLSGAPRDLARQLAHAGIRAVNLANNHIMDAGARGLLSTLEVLADAGIVGAGAGEDHARAAAPAHASGPGGTVALLGAFVAFPTATLLDFFERASAELDRPGVHAVRGSGLPSAPRLDEADVVVLLDAIRRARRVADFVLVSLHYHWPYLRHGEAAPEIGALFRRLIDAGADLVAAHGPHDLRGVEAYRGRYIAHGLGSFTFQLPEGVEDEIRSYFDSNPRFWRSLLIELELERGRGIAGVRCYPLALHRQAPVRGLPYRPTGELAEALLAELESDCRRLGSATRREPDGTLWVSAP